MAIAPPVSRVLDGRADAACRTLELSEAARALLRPGMSVRTFVTLLLEEEALDDSVTVLANVLPKREAVWWACLCIRRTLGEEELVRALPALSAAEGWAARPDEASRRRAEQAAEMDEYGTPQGLAAAGAFWSGGSIAPVSVNEPVPPAEDLTARAVAGAVNLVAVLREPEKAHEKFRLYFQLAQDVASGTQGWDTTARPAKREASR